MASVCQFVMVLQLPDVSTITLNINFLALSRIIPRVRVRVSVRIVYRIATGGYSWIWPFFTYLC